jgi:hypothetical protein
VNCCHNSAGLELWRSISLAISLASR